MIGKEKIEALKKLKEECLNCVGRKGCSICSTKALARDGEYYDRHVFGVGNVNADIMLCAQNPGHTELLQGKPLVGPSGKKTNEILNFIGLERKEVYITNIVKGYTDGNDTPVRDEISACMTFLRKELDIIKPKLIVTFGKPSIEGLTDIQVPITTRCNEFFTTSGRIGNYVIFPMIHPSPKNAGRKYLLDEGMEKLKIIIKNNFKEVEEYRINY